MAKNKISTPSYFIKRLRDNGFYVNRIFDNFGDHDSREWMVMINPGYESVFITYYSNKKELNDTLYEFNDGGNRFPKNFQLSTDSIEVVVSFLLQRGVQQYICEEKTKQKQQEA